jgi:hypothetical protein
MAYKSDTQGMAPAVVVQLHTGKTVQACLGMSLHWRENYLQQDTDQGDKRDMKDIVVGNSLEEPH